MTDEYTKEEHERFRQRFLAEQMAAAQQQSAAAAMTHPEAPYSPSGRGPTMMINDPKRGMRTASALERFILGTGAGAENVLTNIGEMTGIVPTETAQERLRANEPFMQNTAGRIGGFVGETGALTPVTGPFGSTVSAGGRLMGYGGPFVRGMAEGGLSGAITAGPGERRTGAAFGGATALAVPATGGVYRGLTRGMEAAEGAADLGRRGVTLTPGQVNPESNWAMLEESMMGLPFFGPRVAKARQQGWSQTQGLIAQEAAPPGYKLPVKDDVREMYNDLEDAYTQAYGQFKGFPLRPALVRVQGGDVPLSQAMAVPRQAAADRKSRQYVQTYIDNELDRVKGRQLDSADLLAIRSNIRAKAREFAGNKNYPDAEQLFKSAEQKATEILESQLPPDVMKALRDVDAKYGNFKVLQNAIDKSKDRPDAFTPAQFSTAVKESAGSKGQYAGGGGRMRDISQASAEVFPTQQPMTGRQLPGQIAGTVAGVATYPLYGQSPASRLARQLMLGGTKGQRAIQEFEEKFKRKLSPEERAALVSALRAGAGVYGEETRPYPFATTNQF